MLTESRQLVIRKTTFSDIFVKSMPLAKSLRNSATGNNTTQFCSSVSYTRENDLPVYLQGLDKHTAIAIAEC